MTFPSDWPECCPPSDAEPASGIVFRGVRTNPPTDDDFLTYRELGKSDRGKVCEAAGVSVFRDDTDARHYMDKYPWTGDHLARGELRPEHGITKLTARVVGGRKNSHTTWWPYENVNRPSVFSIG